MGYASFGQQNFAYIRELINRYVSVYSNAAYTYDGKYMVSGSIRWDKPICFLQVPNIRNVLFGQ